MVTQSQVIHGVNKRRPWAGMIWLAMGLLILAPLVLIVPAGQSARSDLSARYPAPGRLVDVEGHKMHINCVGDGSPTVIMDSGVGGFSIHWALVQPEIARFTRACVYDRAGYGWSEPSPSPRTSQNLVAELHTLLLNAGIEGPYVLAGHSFGGLNMRLFADHYPDEVTGLLLVDAVHEDQDERLPEYGQAARQLSRQFRFYALLRRLGVVALLPEKIPDAGLPDSVVPQWRAIVATTRYFETSNAESLSLATNLAEFKAAGVADLAGMPLVVLSRGLEAPLPGFPEVENRAREETWRSLQVALAALSSNSQHLIAENSGHDIPLEQPELVVEAARRLVYSQAAAPESSAMIVDAPDPQTAAPAVWPVATPTATPAPTLLPTSTLLPTAALLPTATPMPAATEVPAPAVPVSHAEFTLRTEYRSGKMLYVGVGGDIDGVVNPDLIVAPNTLVRAILVNGDGMNHDLYFPDFDAHTAIVGSKEETAEVSFTVAADQAGTFFYYCTLPGHRQAGQEGQLKVVQN